MFCFVFAGGNFRGGLNESIHQLSRCVLIHQHERIVGFGIILWSALPLSWICLAPIGVFVIYSPDFIQTNQMRKAKAIYSELAVVRKSAIVTCLLAETQRQRGEAKRKALIEGCWHEEAEGWLTRSGTPM